MESRGVGSGDALSYANDAVRALFARGVGIDAISNTVIDFFEDSGDHESQLTKVPEDEMTKTRHRTYEIFDSAEEAKGALASKSALPKTNTDDPQSWSLRHLVASHSAGIVHVKFMKTEFIRADSLRELHDDLSELAGALVNGSRVLLDLEGQLEFGAESIAELVNFNQKLRAKGSRFVLCNLNQAVQASFFPNRNATEGI